MFARDLRQRSLPEIFARDLRQRSLPEVVARDRCQRSLSEYQSDVTHITGAAHALPATSLSREQRTPLCTVAALASQLFH